MTPPPQSRHELRKYKFYRHMAFHISTNMTALDANNVNEFINIHLD